MDYAIWNREEAWPADTDAHVFLARAVQRIGRAMHASEWLGYEMKVRAKGKPLAARGGEIITPDCPTPSGSAERDASGKSSSTNRR